MGKRSSAVYSPVLIEADPEDLPVSKRQKIAHEDAALALLSFQRKSVVNLEPEVIKSASVNKKPKEQHTREVVAAAVKSMLPPSPQDSTTKPVVVKSLPPLEPLPKMLAPLTMPRLPTQVQHRRLPPLPHGRPLPFAPKLAGHLSEKTKPINLSLS